VVQLEFFQTDLTLGENKDRAMVTWLGVCQVFQIEDGGKQFRPESKVHGRENGGRGAFHGRGGGGLFLRGKKTGAGGQVDKNWETGEEVWPAEKKILSRSIEM